MAGDFGELNRTLAGLQRNLERVDRDAGHRVGKAGNEAVRNQYTRLFGADHKFSGARGSKTAGRKATVRYRVDLPHVNIFPSGDPIYITMKGRGRRRIHPKAGRRGGDGHWKAVSAPPGPRFSVLGGRLAPRPNALDPAVRKLADQSARLMSQAVDAAIRKAL